MTIYPFRIQEIHERRHRGFRAPRHGKRPRVYFRGEQPPPPALVGQAGVRAGRTPMSPGVIARQRAGTSPWVQGYPASRGRAVTGLVDTGQLAVGATPGMRSRWAFEASKGTSDWRSHEGWIPPISVGGHRIAQVATRNAVEIANYADAVAQMVEQGVHVPGWVAHKLSRARTDLGDVKHFLEHPQKLQVGARRSRKRKRKNWLQRLFGG